MRAAGTAALAASPARVLAVLRDPRRFAAALPNVEELELEGGESSFRATIRPAIALGEVPIETVWRPRTPSEATPGRERLAYAMSGGTGEHWVELEATLVLRDRDGGGTNADWSVEFEVTGAMRSAGQRAIAAIVAAQAEAVLQAAAEAA